MRRYGGDLKKAKQVLLISSVLIFVLTLPVFWTAPDFRSQATDFLLLVMIGLILFPFALVFIVNFAFKKFERLNR